MRLASRRTSDRPVPTPSRERRRRRKPGFDRLDSRILPSATIVGLGDLGGGSSEATAINNLGQVVGYSTTSNGQDHAFLYSDGTMTDIGTSGASSYAYGINDSGQVAGYSITGSVTHAFRYSDGKLTDLGTLGGAYSFAFAINKSGEVAGYSADANGTPEAFVSDGSTMTDLGGLGTDDQGNSLDSYAYGINNSGQIVGYASVSADGGNTVTSHAFIDSGGVMTDLGAGDPSTALGINNAGQVIGVGKSAYYIESNGVFTTLSALPAGINDNGDVVGYTQGSNSQSDPYLYTQGKMIDLNSLLPANSGWTLTNATAINNHDQIVGVGTYQGHQEAYLLTIGADSGTTPGNGNTSPPPSQGVGGSAPVPPHATQVVAASRTKKGLTAITVAFDEALDGGVVKDQALFNVLGAVKKHHKTIYSKAARIKGISFEGGSRVTINLAKPYKGAVKVTVHGGILAADGASSSGDFSAVVD
jgi:probable HAF family extracellular repeat protein